MNVSNSYTDFKLILNSSVNVIRTHIVERTPDNSWDDSEDRGSGSSEGCSCDSSLNYPFNGY